MKLNRLAFWASIALVTLALVFTEFILVGYLTLEFFPGLGINGWMSLLATLALAISSGWLLAVIFTAVGSSWSWLTMRRSRREDS